MNKTLSLLSLFAGCSILISCTAPAAFDIAPESRKLVSIAPPQQLKTWGILEIPVPDNIELSRNEGGNRRDFDLFYFTPKNPDTGRLFIYVGHNPQSREDKSEIKPESVSLQVMGKTVEGKRLHYNNEDVIEIITPGADRNALLHILLTEGDSKQVLAEMLNRMEFKDS